MMELEFCPSLGFPGSRDGTGRETGRPGPVLEEEKDWEITMDQFSSIIFNLNLLKMFIFLYTYNVSVKMCKQNFKNILVCMVHYVWEITSGILA